MHLILIVRTVVQKEGITEIPRNSRAITKPETQTEKKWEDRKEPVRASKGQRKISKGELKEGKREFDRRYT